MADRLMYLPSFGLIFLIVYLLWKLTRRSYIVFLLCCIGLLYGSATYARNRVWLTQESLSRDAYAKSPDSIVTQLGMAQVFVAQGNTGSARELLLRANATYDKNVEILNLLGVIAWQSKDYPAAEEYFVKVLALRPRYNDALINLSRVYFQQNKIVDTRRILDQMYSYYPDAMGFQNLRLYLYILIQMRAYDDAIRIASAQGNNPEFDFLKGYAYLKKGDRAQAKPLLIDLPNPQSIQNHFNQIAKDFR
jgi:Flp pilus assembly protein TadD